MKTSNKMLLGTFFGVVAVFILASFLSCGFVSRSHVFTSSVAMGEDRAVNIENKTSNAVVGQYGTFNKIDTRGAWEIKIKQGEKCDVKIQAPAELRNLIKVENNGGVLYLSLASHYKDIHDISADITMPKLEEISTAGATDLKFSDFNSDRLAISGSGASDIKGENNVIKDLTLDLSGASHIDLANSKVTNAHLDVTGASHVTLNMMGGNLTGSATGFSAINYSGTVKNQDIRTAGMSSIGRE
jgi:hypothetical protein